MTDPEPITTEDARTALEYQAELMPPELVPYARLHNNAMGLVALRHQVGDDVRIAGAELDQIERATNRFATVIREAAVEEHPEAIRKTPLRGPR